MIISAIAAISVLFPVDPENCLLNYWPLPNIGGILNYFWTMFPGAYSGFYSGDKLKLFDDAQELKPV
jgi:hypothetical protein